MKNNNQLFKSNVLLIFLLIFSQIQCYSQVNDSLCQDYLKVIVNKNLILNSNSDLTTFGIELLNSMINLVENNANCVIIVDYYTSINNNETNIDSEFRAIIDFLFVINPKIRIIPTVKIQNCHGNDTFLILITENPYSSLPLNNKIRIE